MRIAFVCEAVDRTDPMQPTVVTWLDTLARKPGVARVDVAALRVGPHDLPPNVRVTAIGGRTRLATVARFYAAMLASVRRGVDCFFVYQGGPYPLLLLPFRLFAATPVYQWKAHPHVSRAMRFHARWCDTKVFTSTPHAFPMALGSLRVVGQGVCTERFAPRPAARRDGLVTVGRVSPIKRIDRMIDALAAYNRRFAERLALDVYGPVDADAAHQRHLRTRIAAGAVDGLVRFNGAVPQESIPDVLGRHRLFLHCCEGALDKTVVEAMACGTIVLSTNPCVADVLPPDLQAELILPDDPEAQAEHIATVLAWDAARTAETARRLRALVVAEHGVSRLFDELLREIRHDCHDDHEAERPGRLDPAPRALGAARVREAGHRAP